MAIAELNLLFLVLIFMGIYAILALGLNFQWGDTGLLNFAHAGLFAIGAYTTAVLTTAVPDNDLAPRAIGLEFPIVVGILCGMGLAAVTGVLIAATSIRLRGDYFAMVTLSFGETIRFIIANEEWLTGGVQSLTGIGRPLDDRIVFNYDMFYVVVIGAGVLGTYLLVRYLSESPFGRVLHGIREDEGVAKALGKNTAKFKLESFGIGAALAGLAGGLWAHYLQALTPGMFTPSVLFFVWAAVIVGGSGSHRGAIGGAIIIVGMQQATRFLPQDIPFADNLPHVRVILIGLILIGILYYRPYGIWGDKERMAAGDSDGGIS